MSNTASYEYVSQKPGVVLIKAGTTPLKELNGLLGLPTLDSQIKDIPITADSNPLSAGRFVMRPSVDFEFEYTFLEVKVVVFGKIVIRDEQNVKYVAEAGDILVFTPTTKVIFDGESDGEAVYFAHRLPADVFL
ncbi:hypothetical protein [Paenibacillus beijingensis]|uniref:Ethanolamine utilization protein n=1 Tax=Paenibacillus beijingensis TaxID=1126833 RepID=A0A0D5NE96_9BACL|nr:hypothetical protein [Paenibacillus beijingensis]AJY73485.1 hypothetical protein VN24_01160 [Paenibacillus beijingensis]